MATNFYIPDGRDFSSIFTGGNAGISTGFRDPNGTDLGNMFISGNAGVNTCFKRSDNTDLGNLLGTQVYENITLEKSVKEPTILSHSFGRYVYIYQVVTNFKTAADHLLTIYNNDNQVYRELDLRNSTYYPNVWGNRLDFVIDCPFWLVDGDVYYNSNYGKMVVYYYY